MTSYDEELKKLGATLTAISASHRYQTGTFSLPAENSMAAAEGCVSLWVRLVDDMLGATEAQLPKPSGTKTNEAFEREADERGVEGTDSFKVESIVVEHGEKGKSAKVRGGRWKLHGVRVWPEVLEAANIDIGTIRPGEYSKTSLTGKTAIVLMEEKTDEEGKTRMVPRKVVEFK